VKLRVTIKILVGYTQVLYANFDGSVRQLLVLCNKYYLLGAEA